MFNEGSKMVDKSLGVGAEYQIPEEKFDLTHL